MNHRSKYFLVFIVFFLIFFILQISVNKIFDADIFYHLKFAELMGKKLPMADFPWLQFTNFNGSFSDQHWLWHLFLIPLTKMSFPLNVKFFIALLSALFFTLFYFILLKLQIKKTFLWLVIIFICSSDFIFRLQLLRPLLINLPLSLLGFYWLIKQKKINLFIWPILFVLNSYGAILIVAILTFCHFFSQLIINKKFIWQELLIILGGTIIGFILHPQPLNYLALLWQNYQVKPLSFFININAATELEPFSWRESFFNSPVLLICLLIIITIIILISNKKIKPSHYQLNILTFLLSVSVIFFILTLWAQRFIEYFAPFAIILTAYLVTIFQQSPHSEEIKIFLSTIKQKLNRPLIKIYLIIAGIALIVYPFQNLYAAFKNTHSLERYKLTAEWLKNNTPLDSIIFHTSWDAFPRLFFYNDHNRYLVGLDPTFMYLYSHELYWQWRNITENVCAADFQLLNSIAQSTTADCPAELKTPAVIAQTVKNQFNSEYIWVAECDFYAEFKKFLETNPEFFEKMIETDDSSVFKIIK